MYQLGKPPLILPETQIDTRLHNQTLTSSELRLPKRLFGLADERKCGHVVEEASLGGEAEGEVGSDVPELGQWEVEAHAADVLQPHLLRVLVGKDVPVAQELEEDGRKMMMSHILNIGRWPFERSI